MDAQRIHSSTVVQIWTCGRTSRQMFLSWSLYGGVYVCISFIIHGRHGGCWDIRFIYFKYLYKCIKMMSPCESKWQHLEILPGWWGLPSTAWTRSEWWPLSTVLRLSVTRFECLLSCICSRRKNCKGGGFIQKNLSNMPASYLLHHYLPMYVVYRSTCKGHRD